MSFLPHSSSSEIKTFESYKKYRRTRNAAFEGPMENGIRTQLFDILTLAHEDTYMR